MVSMNDKKILDLKTKIALKEKDTENLKFTPVTNCSIEFEEKRYNLHTLSEQKLTLLLVRINLYLISMKDLGIQSCSISGYSVEEWLRDLKLKLKVIAQKSKMDELAILNKKLHMMLSDDKKTELELDSIETILKE